MINKNKETIKAEIRALMVKLISLEALVDEVTCEKNFSRFEIRVWNDRNSKRLARPENADFFSARYEDAKSLANECIKNWDDVEIIDTITGLVMDRYNNSHFLKVNVKSWNEK